MANRRNRKRPSDRRKAERKQPPADPAPSGGVDPFREEFDRARDTLHPGLRMKLVSIPCPSCNTLIDALAENRAEAQEVRLIGHQSASGKSCEASGSLFTLPASGDNDGFAYAPLGLPPELDPSSIESYTPAPPSCRSSSDGMFDYALACPIATLIKLHSEVDKMAESAFNISHIFRPDDAFEDPFSSHVEALKSRIERALELRFAAGIARALHIEGDHLSFQDPATREYVSVPFGSLRVRQFRSTMIRPQGVDEAGAGPDEDLRVFDDDPAGEDD